MGENRSKLLNQSSNGNTVHKDIHRFNKWAKDYEQSWLQAIIFNPVHQEVLRQIENLPTQVQSILDIGCGTGRFLRMIRHRYLQARLFGIDASKEIVSSNLKCE
jgi:trans-aconitate methyltransferase